jgi:hypothetical protein
LNSVSLLDSEESFSDAQRFREEWKIEEGC